MTNTHTGGCHCGAIRFQVESDLSQVISCNCSFCSKTGALLTFVPAEKFTLHSGENHLNDYQFNKKVIHHLFCNVCGIRPFGRGKGQGGSEMVAINVRCLDNVDPDTLTVSKYDGKSA